MSEYNNTVFEEVTTSNIFIVNDYAGRAIVSDDAGQSTSSASAINVTIPENRSIQSIQRRQKVSFKLNTDNDL